MSEYGYNSYGYGGGYGYAMYLPGGGLDARQGLQGPGTSAYYQQGPYSSYASESDRGGIIEQNTTIGSRDTTTTTSYDYGNSSYRHSHYESHTYYNVPDHYGRAYGETYPVTETYRDITGIKFMTECILTPIDLRQLFTGILTGRTHSSSQLYHWTM